MTNIYDVVYRRRGGVGVAMIRRDGEDILMWMPDQNFPGGDGEPISRTMCPGAWNIVDQLGEKMHAQFDEDFDDFDDFDDDDLDDDFLEENYNHYHPVHHRPSLLQYIAAWGVRAITFMLFPVNLVLFLSGFLLGAFWDFWRDGFRTGLNEKFYENAVDTIHDYKVLKK